MNQSTDPEAAEDSAAELRALVCRVEQGQDPTALTELRQAMTQSSEIWRKHGDLAAKAERSWVTLVCGEDLAWKENVTRKLAELKIELAGPDPSLLESLLAARAAIAWLQVHAADLEAVNAQYQVPASFSYHDMLQRRQGQAQRRYAAALKVIATVQKLLRKGTSPSKLAHDPFGEVSPLGLHQAESEIVPTIACQVTSTA